MKYLKTKLISIIFIALVPLILLSSDSVFGDWVYSKDLTLKNIDSDYSIYTFDNDVYRYSNKGFSDIRIADVNGNEIPYFIISSESVRKNEKRSFKTAEILYGRYKETDIFYKEWQVVGNKKELKYNRIEFNIAKNRYSVQVSILGRYDNTDWSYIKKDTIYNIGGIEKKYIELDNYTSFKYLKIVTNGKKVIPYLKSVTVLDDISEIKENDFQTEVSANDTVEQKENKTEIIIDNSNRRIIDKIVLEAEDNYYRNASIYKGENIIENAVFSRTNFNNDEILQSEYLISGERSDSFKIIIDNKNDAPLKIKKIDLILKEYKLIFKNSKEINYKIYFGNEKANYPQYDIVNFKNEIIKKNFNRVETSNFKRSILAEEENSDKLKLLFNIAIVVVSVVLIIMIAFKIKPEKK